VEERARSLEREIERQQTRRSVLRAELERSGAAPATDLIDREAFPGLLGRISELVRAAPGYERALAAALEPYAGALVARSLDDAAAAVARLRETGGRVAFLVAGRVRPPGRPPGGRRPHAAARSP